MLAGGIAGATLAEAGGAGHMLICTHPSELVGIIRDWETAPKAGTTGCSFCEACFRQAYAASSTSTAPRQPRRFADWPPSTPRSRAAENSRSSDGSPGLAARTASQSTPGMPLRASVICQIIETSDKTDR